jgi:tetratricopeptide (TPR) repeat protein
MPTRAAPSKSTDAEIEPSPEVRLKQAWDRYGGLFYFACGVVALGILAKGGWRYLNEQKELGIQKEYSECVTPDSYLAFAVKHPGHPLAGVAEETVADNAYASGRYLDALKAYSSAATDLPEGPLRGHAKLGQAMSLELTGRTGEAEADLRQLVDDAGQMKAVRCEAGYHLAGIEVAAGRGAEVQKLAEQLIKIDPANAYSERTFMLRPPGPEAASPTGTLTVPSIALPSKP